MILRITLILIVPFSDVGEIFVVVDVVVLLVGLVAERLRPDRRKSDSSFRKIGSKTISHFLTV